MSKTERATLAAAISAAVLVNSPSPLKIASASAERLGNIEPAATTEPVALYVTLCLWSAEHPKPSCRDLPLTPGPAGPRFVSMKACQDGRDEALHRWFAEAGPVFGFTSMAGEGYRIEAIRCTPIPDCSAQHD